jgi:hypothetical protein
LIETLQGLAEIVRTGRRTHLVSAYRLRKRVVPANRNGPRLAWARTTEVQATVQVVGVHDRNELNRRVRAPDENLGDSRNVGRLLHVEEHLAAPRLMLVENFR